MPNSIYPCLWFNGNAKEAADFYCSLFDNSLILSESQLVVQFELNGKKMMGLNGGPMFNINPSISMTVHCNSIEKCKDLWNKLSENGNVLFPLDKYPWSEQYGWIQDRFGFSWQLSLAPSDNLTPSLLFTGKQLGNAVPAMDFYSSLFKNSGVDFKNYYPEGSPFAGKVNYASFHLDNYPLIAMDGPNEHNYSFNEAVSFVVECQNQEEIDYYWNHFTKNGGEESMCGWCKDKFGLSWQVVPANIGKLIGNPTNGQRAMQALLKMKKLDIAALENA